MTDVWTPIIVAAGVILGPLFLAYLTGRQRSAEKREDWARQDAVAVKAAAAVQAVDGKLGQIHALVNSNLTTQMEEAYTAVVQQLVLMREVVALNRAAGREPSSRAVDAIAAIEARVGNLQAQLADRAQSTRIADAKTTPG